jgi:hypothetical protein
MEWIRPTQLKLSAFATAQTLEKTPQELYKFATSGSPTFSDPLTGGSSNDWSTSPVVDDRCNITSAGLDLTNASSYAHSPFCFGRAINLSNFVFQVEVTGIQADYGYSAGLVFRISSPENNGPFYMFSIGVFGANGTYELSSSAGIDGTKLLFSSSPVIHTGLHQPNLLTVIALGSDIYLYANKQFLGHGSDTTSQQGMIGMYVANDQARVDVIFKDVQVWSL